jgi:hypothetical protein
VEAPDLKTVEAVLVQLRITVAGEDARTRHLDGKAAQVLTFSGVLLALTATLGGVALTTSLPGWARVLEGAFFGLALTFFLGACVISVRASSPAQFLDLDEDALEAFLTEPKLRLPTWRVQGD